MRNTSSGSSARKARVATRLPNVYSLPSAFPCAAWGNPAPCLIRNLPKCVSTDAHVAVEGITLVSRCVCGSRVEKLLDLRNLSFEEMENQLYRSLSLAAPDTAGAAVRRWARAHRNCNEFTGYGHVDERVVLHAYATWRSAVERFDESPSHANLEVLLDDGGLLELNWPVFESDDDVGTMAYWSSPRERSQRLGSES